MQSAIVVALSIVAGRLLVPTLAAPADPERAHQERWLRCLVRVLFAIVAACSLSQLEITLENLLFWAILASLLLDERWPGAVRVGVNVAAGFTAVHLLIGCRAENLSAVGVALFLIPKELRSAVILYYCAYRVGANSVQEAVAWLAVAGFLALLRNLLYAGRDVVLEVQPGRSSVSLWEPCDGRCAQVRRYYDLPVYRDDTRVASPSWLLEIYAETGKLWGAYHDQLLLPECRGHTRWTGYRPRVERAIPLPPCLATIALGPMIALAELSLLANPSPEVWIVYMMPLLLLVTLLALNRRLLSLA